MRGISDVIAVTMILMITIALSSLGYIWFTGIFSSVSNISEQSVNQTTNIFLTKFKIESIIGNKIFIRNTGNNPISNTTLSIYANDVPISFVAPPIINPGSIAIINLTSFFPCPTNVRVITTGFEDTKLSDYIFSDNFDDGDANGWTNYGAGATWRVSGGEYMQDNTAVSNVFSNVGNTEWKNYTLEVNIKPNSGSYAGVQVRANPSYTSSYYWLIGITATGGSGYSKLWGYEYTGYQLVDGATLILGQWNNVKVVASGNILKLYLRGVLRDQVTVNQLAGAVGLATYNSNTSFDNITIC